MFTKLLGKAKLVFHKQGTGRKRRDVERLLKKKFLWRVKYEVLSKGKTGVGQIRFES